jgi:hypothetical protein
MGRVPPFGYQFEDGELLRWEISARAYSFVQLCYLSQFLAQINVRILLYHVHGLVDGLYWSVTHTTDSQGLAYCCPKVIVSCRTLPIKCNGGEGSSGSIDMFAEVFRADKKIVYHRGNPVPEVTTVALLFVSSFECVLSFLSRTPHRGYTYSASEIFASSPSSLAGARKRAVIFRWALQPASASMLAMFSFFSAVRNCSSFALEEYIALRSSINS